MSQTRPRRRSFFSGIVRLSRQYLKSKIGVVGLAIILFFLILAVFSSALSRYNPVADYDAGAPYSIPSWATIFPQYSGFPVTGYPILPTGFASTSDLGGWKLSGVANGTLTTGTSDSAPKPSKYTDSTQINASIIPVQLNTTNAFLPGGQAFFSLSQSFKWTTKPPNAFLVAALIEPVKMQNVSNIYLNLILSNPTTNFSLSTTHSSIIDSAIDLSPKEVGTWRWANVTDSDLLFTGLPHVTQGTPTQTVFNTKGTYELTIQVQGVPDGANPSISLDIATATFHIQGDAFGILGTDNLGRDVWSEFVWGSRVSFLVGVLSGLGAVALGTIGGLVAGYLGGLWDEILSRFTDFFLVLPFLPLLIILVLILGNNPSLRPDIYFYVISIFAILTWPSIAKIIRSQVLTVKERQYVEASRAVGGGTFHILRKHILPNVMGLVYSQIALNVSGFILLEAALDFLAINVTPATTISWGIMLTNALPYATRDSSLGYVWWWFLPPGIAIAALSLAFVLVGFALDSIFNPRLRAR